MAGHFGRGEVAAIVVAILGTALVCVAVGLARDSQVPTSSGPAAQPGAPVDPESAVGAWWLEGDPALDGRLVALLPSGEMTIYGDHGCEFYGTWSLTESGLATVGIDSWASCTDAAKQALPTASSVAGIRLVGDVMTMTTSEGDVVATLREAPDPAAWPETAQADDDLAAALQEPYEPPEGASGLPEGMVPPTPEQLTSGRWVPLSAAESDQTWQDQPYAEFNPSGGWSGSDGCNGQGGSWSLDSETGEWLAGAGMQTLIGCDNVDVAGMLMSARAVAFEDGELVFFDKGGAEASRFVPQE